MARHMTVLITRARPAQLELVRGMLAAAELPTDGLDDQFPHGYVLALSGGGVVGAAGVEVYGRDGLLRSVVVDPARRGTGLGHTLTFDRISWAKKQGLESLWLLTSTAAPFFRRIGFTPAERDAAPPDLRASKEFAGACPDTATCLRLDLTTVPLGAEWLRWVAGHTPRDVT